MNAVQSIALSVFLLVTDAITASAWAPPEQVVFRQVDLENSSETSANVSIGDLDGVGDSDVVLAKGRHWPLSGDLNGDGTIDLIVGDDRLGTLVCLTDGWGSFPNMIAVGQSKPAPYAIAYARV